MGDARIPNIINGARGTSPQSMRDADLQRLSGLLKPFLQSHLSLKAIDKLARDPRLYSFFQDLFANHRSDEILKIAVISERGQITIRATLNKEVTQCGVDLSRDGYSSKRECTTSNITISESTLKLDRNYVVRLNARPRIHVTPPPPPEVASAPKVVEPPPVPETLPPPKKLVVDRSSQQSLLERYDSIYAQAARPPRPQPPREKGQPSVVIIQNPSGIPAPGTLMHELTRPLTPREQLSSDIFREGMAADVMADVVRQEEAAPTQAPGSTGIVMKAKIDLEEFNRKNNPSAAQKAANLFWVDTAKVPPGQMLSSFHRLFENRPEKWEKLLGRDSKVLPAFEEVQSDFRADRQLPADVALLLLQILPDRGTIAQKLLEGTYWKNNRETTSRTIWVHAWLGKMVQHPGLLTDKSLQKLSPTERQILMSGIRRWSHLKVYSSYHPVFRNIVQHHFRAFAGQWTPDTIAHLSAFPNRYLFLTNWVAEVGRTHLDHGRIASQLNSKEYEILHTMVGGGLFDIPDEATRLASLDILELAQKSLVKTVGTISKR